MFCERGLLARGSLEGNAIGRVSLRGSFVDVGTIVGLILGYRTLRRLQRLLVGGLLGLDDGRALVAASGELGGS